MPSVGQLLANPVIRDQRAGADRDGGPRRRYTRSGFGRCVVPPCSILAILISVHSIVAQLSDPYQPPVAAIIRPDTLAEVMPAPVAGSLAVEQLDAAVTIQSVKSEQLTSTDPTALRADIERETNSPEIESSGTLSPPSAQEEPDVPTPAPAAITVAVDPGPKRIRVRMNNNRTVIARVYGKVGEDYHILLPDGQIGMPDRPAFTEEPFRPATADEMIAELLAGPFAGFQVRRTQHYLIVYRCTEAFAEECALNLENLYKGLTDAFRKFEVPMVEAEFPLVAVIFRTEREFRAHKRVDPQIQAYYEIYTNRIFFYESSEGENQAPEVAALRRPQTVTHEGTHQIIQNIGIQPRLAAWPPWLIEGLAEYCSSPLITKKATTWGGLGLVNPLHMATIRDLADPLSGQVPGASRPEHIGRPPGMSLVEYLVKKTDLTPTDYALAWAMTYYLAKERVDEFVAFLKMMSALPPLEKRTPDEHLASFKAAFGTELAKLDKDINAYLKKLKVTHQLPYYAVMLEQHIGNGRMKRAAIVSQSPSMIRQWLETVSVPSGEPPVWEALPYPSRARAMVTADEWVRSR
jgi:hypothetical protein